MKYNDLSQFEHAIWLNSVNHLEKNCEINVVFLFIDSSISRQQTIRRQPLTTWLATNHITFFDCDSKRWPNEKGSCWQILGKSKILVWYQNTDCLRLVCFYFCFCFIYLIFFTFCIQCINKHIYIHIFMFLTCVECYECLKDVLEITYLDHWVAEYDTNW